MSITFQQLAYLTMRDLGVLRPAQTGAPDVLSDMLNEANDMLDSYKLNRFLVLSENIASYTLTTNLQTYQIGAGQTGNNFNAVRPTSIEKANVVYTATTPVVRCQLQMLNFKEWSEIAIQNVTASQPMKMYYDKGFDPTTGFGTIYLFPKPDAAYALELYTWDQTQWSGFADLTTAYNFPPGYQEMIRRNLAVRCLPMMRIYLKTPMDPVTLAELKSAAEMLRVQMQQYNAPQTTIAPAMGAPDEAVREAPVVTQ